MLTHHIILKYHFQFGFNKHYQRDLSIKMELKPRNEHEYGNYGI